MLNATKVSLMLTTLGIALDVITTDIMLLMPEVFEESNPLYDVFGHIGFHVLVILLTLGVLLTTVMFDRVYASEDCVLTSIGSIAFGAIYGGYHLYLGIHNILVFLSVAHT